ncbi:MAG: copper resistance D family protein [Alphaproteobacteria bacterium]
MTALVLDTFAYFSVLLRGFILAAQSFTVGGVVFAACLLVPVGGRLDADEDSAWRVCRRLVVISALALASIEALSLAQMVFVLVQSTEMPAVDALGASYAISRVTSAAAALGIALLAHVGLRRMLPWIGLLAAAIIAGSTATSHAAARMGQRDILLIADALHQLGAAAWIGGIPYFLLTLHHCRTGEAIRTVGRRFSVMSMISVATLVAAGVLMSLAYIDNLQALYGTTYGAMLMTKTALFGCVLLLGALNYGVVERVRRNPMASITRLRRFAEAEVAIGVTVLFIAASLTSMPPAVDLPSDRLTVGELTERLVPNGPPRLVSPSRAELSNLTMEQHAERAALAQRSVQAFNLADTDPNLARTDGDRAWSEFNHNWAGIFVLAIGLLALAERTGRAPWARHWPLVFLGLAAFLFIRSDPSNWPMGDNGFFESFADTESLQHRLIVFLVIAFSFFEWGVRTGYVKSPRAALVFPVLTGVGAAFLLTHSHALSNFKDALLVEYSHLMIGFFGVVAGWSRWLELRLPPENATIPSWIWRICFVLIGLILIFYRETAAL